jgi:branched-chain amino acid transport system substrate-binding protein
MARSHIQRRTALKTVGSMGAVGLAGCLGDIEGDSGENEPFVIGSITDLSGPYSDLGEAVRDGVQLAVDHANENGGVAGRDVEVVHEDSELDAERAVRLAERLIDREGVSLITGFVSTANTLAVSPIANQNEVLLTAGGSAVEMVGESCAPYTFNWNIDPVTIIQSTFPWVIENNDVESVYTISSDYSWGQNMVATAEDLTDELGYEFAGNTYVELGQSDFAGPISQAMDSGADMLMLNIGGGDLINCCNQLLGFDADQEFDTMVQPLSSIPNYKAIDDMEPFTVTTSFWWQADGAEDFVSRWMDAYDSPPVEAGGRHYGAVTTPLEVANSLGTTETDAIATELEGYETDDYYKGGRLKIPECTHQIGAAWYVGEGKAESEMENEHDYIESTIENAIGCQDECDLPAW